MKSYLSLIHISAKVQRRQNRMTLLCITFAVFLVTAVFGMADMGARMEQTRLLEKHQSLIFSELLGSAMAQQLFLAAAVLFVLVLIAGVLMISSSMNSTVAQRTSFFGMMRCIGMSKAQIIRFVRLEALNWCRRAVPIGVMLGIAATWGLCAALRFFVGEEFSNIPIFGVSVIGIISGIVVGVATVLIAAGSPAKRAAKVSPIAAISGNLENNSKPHCAVRSRIFKIETALGIHHAVSAKKNLALMTGSFALSIILFFSFSVLIDFIGYLMPQSSSAADLVISSSGNSIDSGLLDTISGMDGIRRVFGRRSCLDVPAVLEEQPSVDTVDVISYDDFELGCLSKDRLLKKGSDISMVYGDSGHVLATWDQDSLLKLGDRIWVNGKELEIAGLLKFDPFNSDGLTNGKVTLIASGDTFAHITGVTDYSLLMAQTIGDATDEEIAAVSSVLDENCVFQDKRDQRTTGVYMAFVLCVYGFLSVIVLVSILNIMSSISMSVSARIKQYGAMRAVGMDERQMVKMIAAEAFTYASTGCITGCTIGLLISRWIYGVLITSHFSYAVWRVPAASLAGVHLFVLAAAAVSVYAPSKRLCRMEITEILNEL